MRSLRAEKSSSEKSACGMRLYADSSTQGIQRGGTYVRSLGRRYLGTKGGDAYVESTRDDPSYADKVLVRMRPERWLTVDYAKEGA